MKMNKENKKNMPNTPGEWITEIAEAYYYYSESFL